MKRKAHLSSLICSNQISRLEALKTLKEPCMIKVKYKKIKTTFEKI